MCQQVVADEDERLQDMAKKLDNNLSSFLRALDIKFTVKQEQVLNKSNVFYQLTVEGISVVFHEDLLNQHSYDCKLDAFFFFLVFKSGYIFS